MLKFSSYFNHLFGRKWEPLVTYYFENFERDKLGTNAHWSFVPLPNSMSTSACPPLDGIGSSLIMVEKKKKKLTLLIFMSMKVLYKCASHSPIHIHLCTIGAIWNNLGVGFLLKDTLICGQEELRIKPSWSLEEIQPQRKHTSAI